jgi:chaperone modulatory protein CbpM
MISDKELIAAIDGLQADALQHWIDLGWVTPQRDNETLRFDASDVARVRLIYELHYELSIAQDSLPVVLSLMDQLYAARRSMRTLMGAIDAQPEDIRSRIVALVKPSA